MAVGIAIIMLIGGIAALKQAASKKEMKYPDYWWSRGGAVTAFIMAAICAFVPFLSRSKSLVAAGVGTALLLINGLYWFIRRVSFDLKEARRNIHAKSEKI